MCVVSNIGDGWSKRFPEVYPWAVPHTTPPTTQTISVGISRWEFDALKKEVEALRELLIAAKKFDEETGQPDCEVDEKVALIKKVAELVGVDISDVFK